MEGPALDRLATQHPTLIDHRLWADLSRLKAELAEARALMVRNQVRVDAELLQAAPRLEVLGRVGVGMDNVDVESASARGIVICYAPDENAVSVAEHVFALMLGLARRIPSADRSVRAGRWERREHKGFELHGKTLGILGLGKIGCRVALRARAFGMAVRAYDPYLSAHHLNVTETGAELGSLEEVLGGAEIISVHLPLTDETRGLLGAQGLSQMKPGAVLINTSRGGIIDEAALYEALASGRLGGAALDVREAEPPGDAPLHTLDNVLFTPHVAAWTREAQEKVLETVCGDVDRVLQGHPAQRYWNFASPRR
jgi:D-3-phosphoglycerate dehydrogenase